MATSTTNLTASVHFHRQARPCTGKGLYTTQVLCQDFHNKVPSLQRRHCAHRSGGTLAARCLPAAEKSGNGGGMAFYAKQRFHTRSCIKFRGIENGNIKNSKRLPSAVPCIFCAGTRRTKCFCLPYFKACFWCMVKHFSQVWFHTLVNGFQSIE